jgi:thiamine-phosphate pyrophosphorylase
LTSGGPGTPVTLADRLAVYLVADPDQSDGPLVDQVEAALAGGVTAVQLRAKRLTDRELVALADGLAARCRAAGALFVVNDRLDVALAAGANGVHLGVDDLPIERAREIVGPSFVIGYSPETDDQAAMAARRGASYLGVGPVFGTRSKADAGDAIGLTTLRRRVDLARCPVIGIGGIDQSNVASVVETGAVGVAVVSAILRAADPQSAARLLALGVRSALDRSPGERSG